MIIFFLKIDSLTLQIGKLVDSQDKDDNLENKGKKTRRQVLLTKLRKLYHRQDSLAKQKFRVK